MQGNGLDILPALLFGTVVLLLLAAGYGLVAAYSKRRILAAERSKLEEVSKSEKKYRGLYDNSLAGIIRFSVGSWHVIDANEAARSMLGGSTKESLQAAIERFPADTMLSVSRQLERESYVGQTEIRVTNADGEHLWFLFAAKKLEQEGIAQAFLIDITQRKQFEEKNREQSALLDQAQDAFIVTNERGVVKSWNAGAVGLYGWSEAEVVGKSLSQFMYANGERESLQSALEDVVRMHEWHGEQFHKRKDTKTVLVEGRWKTITGTRDSDPVILMVNRDITEKRRLEAQSERAQRAQMMAMLAGGLAHDLQNILAPVRMSARFLRNKVTGKSSQAVVKALDERAKSGLQLVKDILRYGSGTGIRLNRLDIRKIVNDVVATVGRRARKRVQIQNSFEGQVHPILGDASQLKQAFLNICYNAQEAMPNGGILKVETTTVTHDEKLFESHPGAPDGPYVVVRIRDSGEGIPEEHVERIFEPFFTTKEHKGGTGLGLAIARAVVVNHNGYITVESTRGKGATFSVYLPVVRREHKEKGNSQR